MSEFDKKIDKLAVVMIVGWLLFCVAIVLLAVGYLLKWWYLYAGAC